MNRRVLAALTALALGASMLCGCNKEVQETGLQQTGTETVKPSAAPMDPAKTGEQLYMQHCAACHPEGGNRIKPDKTLHSKALEADGINSVDGIVGYMRKPGPAMPAYDEKKIPDSDAKAIARYILKTF